MRNLLTIDVEEYFHDEGFADVISRRDWKKHETRVRRQTTRLLDLLDAKRRRGTFFVLGWTAAREPQLVREIAARGHEVASHGYSHRPIDAHGMHAFRRDVRRGKRVLEDILGAPVRGYRAPGFSISERTPWAHRVLADEGFAYSSSVFPARFDKGDAPAPRTPWEADGGDDRRITELPPLTRRLFGQNVPVAGGGYMRLLPARVVSTAISAMNRRGAPAVVCLSPWEIDGSQVPPPDAAMTRWRHWAGIAEFEAKLSTILGAHDFGPIGEFVGLKPQTPGAEQSARAAS